MFIVQDIETLGIESTSVILSNTFLLVHEEFLPENNTDAFYYLCKNSITVKFKVAPQLEIGRTKDKDTVEWWKKQTDFAKQTSFLPNKNLDKDPKEGIAILRSWVENIPNYKKMPVWVRGSLDQPCFQSFLRSFSEPDFVSYNCYRDVRTMIELVYPNSKGGYVEVPDFDTIRHVFKHVPEHDCAYDALMMLRGKL